MSRSDLGISGRIAAAFLESRMTPLLALVAFLLGLFATLVTPLDLYVWAITSDKAVMTRRRVTERELRRCIEIIERSGLPGRRGYELWIMAEVPSVLFNLERYAALGITGISIGSPFTNGYTSSE